MMQNWVVRVLYLVQTAVESTEDPFKAIVDLLKSLFQEIDFWLDVAKITFPIALVAVCIVVVMLNTKGKVLRKLNKQTKKMLMEMQTIYTPVDSLNKSIGICGDILPDVKDSENTIQLEDISEFLCCFMKKPVNALVGQGGMGKTSVLLYIAEQVLNKPQNLRRNGRILVQVITASQINDLVEQNPNQTQMLLSIIRQRVFAPKHRPILEALNSEDLTKAEKFLNVSLKDKYNKLFFPNGTWSSFECRRKKKKGYDFKLLLLVDGYDELTQQARNALQEELSRIRTETSGSVSVIITSRYKPDAAMDSSYELQPLRKDQIENYISSNLATNNRPANYESLLDTPIMLTMYCKTCRVMDLHTNIPFHRTIDSMSDIYWNYFCSLLTRSRAKKESEQILAKKVVLLFLVLPRLAMELEANGDRMHFSLDRDGVFGECIRHIIQNNQVLLGNFNPVFSRLISGESYLTTGIVEWLDKIGCDTEATDFVSRFLKETAVIKYESDVHNNLRYSFAHTYYRNFLAAVYRVQRDVATLYEVNDGRNVYIPYQYAACERLPDISLVLRKFYYELIAYHFRHELSVQSREQFFVSSVRYNSLLSDIYYYGDAENMVYDESLRYEHNFVTAFKHAQQAIAIGHSRIEGLDQPDEMNKRTDLLLLCWVRWNATHLIQFDLGPTEQELKNLAYEYSKANSLAEGYGEFIGYDKLAQLLYTKNFLPEYIINKERKLIPPTGRNNKPRSEEERLRLRWLECLQRGKNNRYHFSFNKHAIWLERELMMCQKDGQVFGDRINEIYGLLKESYACKPNDYYALSRIMFYEICYGEYIANHIKERMDDLIGRAKKSMSQQLAFHKTSELYGYNNFCENAGFWFMMKMICCAKKPTLGNFEELISKLWQISSMQICMESAQQAADYYKKLYVSVYDQQGDSIDNKPNEAKTLCKAVVAYRFIQWVCQNCKENFRITLEDICSDEEATQLQLEKIFGGNPNKFFREDRYWKLYKILQEHQTVEV